MFMFVLYILLWSDAIDFSYFVGRIYNKPR
nr:MAG TPA: hypothetical protein [Caudoviricetes sp.]